jgi:glycosyltransferase involved in cell wall biosynthesis
VTRLLALTSRVPYSTTEEAFVQDELEMLKHQGMDLIVVPARVTSGGPNPAAVASGLADVTVGETLASPTVLRGALSTLARHPIRSIAGIFAVLSRAGGLRNFATNFAVIPKALWLAGLVAERRVTHIHAYWLGHTATAALVASRISSVPWSATGYRWDIDAKNAIGPKVREAQFLRVADELGERQLTDLASRLATHPAPIELIRTGVALPAPAAREAREPDAGVLCCAAAFVPKKGHAVLIDAFADLVGQGRAMHLHLFGQGPLLSDVTAAVKVRGLVDQVTFHGVVPLAELRAFLLDRRPVVVLPSITAEDGQQEGIPVVLIEAMAAGCPVVSTRTGSIPSLVLDGCGWLVDGGDSVGLSRAIQSVADDPAATQSVTKAAADRVTGQFELGATAAQLAGLIRRDGSRP